MAKCAAVTSAVLCAVLLCDLCLNVTKASKMQCRLNLEGNTTRDGLVQAGLSCTGGVLFVYIDTWAPNGSSSGRLGATTSLRPFIQQLRANPGPASASAEGVVLINDLEDIMQSSKTLERGTPLILKAYPTITQLSKVGRTGRGFLSKYPHLSMEEFLKDCIRHSAGASWEAPPSHDRRRGRHLQQRGLAPGGGPSPYDEIPEKPSCLLTVCGATASEVEFVGLHINNVVYAHSDAKAVLCVGDALNDVSWARYENWLSHQDNPNRTESMPQHMYTQYIFKNANVTNNTLGTNGMPAYRGSSPGWQEGVIDESGVEFRSRSPGGIVRVAGVNAHFHKSLFLNNTVEYRMKPDKDKKWLAAQDQVTSGGALLVVDCFELVISDSTFANNQLTGWGVDQHVTQAHDMARIGGAVCAAYVAQVLVSGSRFLNNSCAGNGGAAAMWKCANVTLHQSTFLSNTACTGHGELHCKGGALWYALAVGYWNDSARYGGYMSEAVIEDCTFVNNSVSGAHYQSETPLTGGAIAVASASPGALAKLASKYNDTCMDPHGVFMCDRIKMTVDSSTFVDNHVRVFGGASGGALSVEGYVSLTLHNASFARNRAILGSDIYGNNRSEVSMSACTGISPGGSTVYWLHSKCQIGEVAQGSGLCVACPSRTFVLTSTEPSCHPCPPHAVCAGGSHLQPVPGFWHSSPLSPQMHRCPMFTTTCPEAGLCATGYVGPLCGKCAVGYGSTSSPLKCGRCLPFKLQLLLYIVAGVLSLLLMVYASHSTWVDNLEGSREVRPTDLLKPLIQFLQYVVIVSRTSAPWPDSVFVFFRLASVVFATSSAGEVVSLDCLLSPRITAASRLPLAVTRQLVYLCAPFVAMLAVVLIEVLCSAVRACCKSRSNHERRVARGTPRGFAKIPTIMLVVLFFAYPSLVSVALNFFACYPIDSVKRGPDNTTSLYPQYATLNASKGYFVGDLSQACYTGWHARWVWLGVFCTLIFCVAVPVCMFAVLWLKRGQLYPRPGEDKTVQMRFGFLYRNFRPERCIWECVWAVFTIVLTVVSTFRFILGSFYSCLLLNTAFVLNAVLLIVFKPFRSQRLHILQLLSTTCLYFTTLVALTLFSMDVQPDTTYVFAISIVVIIVDAAFVLACIGLIVHASTGNLKVAWRCFSGAVLRRCFPVCCARSRPVLPILGSRPCGSA